MARGVSCHSSLAGVVGVAQDNGSELVEKAAYGGALSGVEGGGERPDVGRERRDVPQHLVARVRRDVDLKPPTIAGMGLAGKVAALTYVMAASSAWLMPRRRPRVMCRLLSATSRRRVAALSSSGLVTGETSRPSGRRDAVGSGSVTVLLSRLRDNSMIELLTRW
jgi:hypothetical protein